MKTQYQVRWNGKVINTLDTLESAKQTLKGTERDYGPLPKGTLTITDVEASFVGTVAEAIALNDKLVVSGAFASQRPEVPYVDQAIDTLKWFVLWPKMNGEVLVTDGPFDTRAEAEKALTAVQS